jgi:hypothetical protein
MGGKKSSDIPSLRAISSGTGDACEDLLVTLIHMAFQVNAKEDTAAIQTIGRIGP